jgi:hypothetical protein
MHDFVEIHDYGDRSFVLHVMTTIYTACAEEITKTHHNCGYGLKKAPPFIFLTENQQFDLTA